MPDTAVIAKVTLKIKKQNIAGGGNPVTIFQAATSKTYGPFKPAAVNNWYSIDLTNGKAYINKLAANGGLTQIRLRFKLDDNNNAIANYLSLFSGNAPTASRPQLIVDYYIP